MWGLYSAIMVEVWGGNSVDGNKALEGLQHLTYGYRGWGGVLSLALPNIAHVFPVCLLGKNPGKKSGSPGARGQSSQTV